MFRVVLDANEFVSALLKARGFPAKILNAWRNGAFELATSRSEARFLVTGDSDLLRITEYESVKILTARQFVTELKYLGLIK